MIALIDFFNTRLHPPASTVGGVVCILVAVACWCLVRQFHNITRELEDDKPVMIPEKGFFVLNSAVFLLSIVMIMKGCERLIMGDPVTVVDLVRDIIIFVTVATWAVMVRVEWVRRCKSKPRVYGKA